MKLKSYKLLFHLFSFLSDKTDGASFFVKYKLLLGTLIVSLAGTSAQAQKKEVVSNTISPLIPDRVEITCYKAAVQSKGQGTMSDSIEVKGKVIDEQGNPVIGAVIRIKGNNDIMIITDINGLFNLKTKANNILVFELMGLEKIEMVASAIKENQAIIMKDLSPDNFGDKVLISCYAVQVIEEPTIKVKTPINIDSITNKPLNINISNEIIGIMCYGITVNPYNNDDIYAHKPKEREFYYHQVTIKPISPAGNLEDFEKWVQSHIRYTEQMRKDRIEGEVKLSFVIDKKGKLINKKIVKGLSKEVDKEVLNAVSKSKKWKPGQLYGNPVKTEITITIQLNNNLK